MTFLTSGSVDGASAGRVRPLADIVQRRHHFCPGKPALPSVGNRSVALVRGSAMARGSIWLDMSAPCGKAGMAEIFHADAFGEFALNSLGNAGPLAASGVGRMSVADQICAVLGSVCKPLLRRIPDVPINLLGLDSGQDPWDLRIAII